MLRPPSRTLLLPRLRLWFHGTATARLKALAVGAKCALAGLDNNFSGTAVCIVAVVSRHATKQKKLPK
jgi:hypothetical protein